MNLLDNLNSIVKIKENEPLKAYTTFNIGGPARYFARVDSEAEIRELYSLATKAKLPIFILGGGSNLLVSDQGFGGLVIKINSSRIKIKGDLLEAEAGALLSKVLGEAVGNGLLGLEWAAGIPGTIAGAVRGNAGAYGGEMGQNVFSVKVLRKGKIKELKPKDCRFGYRESVFKEEGSQNIILSVVFQLKKVTGGRDLAEAKERVKRIIKERMQKFGSLSPVTKSFDFKDGKNFSAGSVFKNILFNEEEMKNFKNKFTELPERLVEYKKIPAAWLIEQCGLKGKTIGGVKVLESHAGIIVNNGTATAEDVVILISIIKQKVRSKFNLQLVEEIEYLGF